jgi:hypothetical protein
MPGDARTPRAAGETPGAKLALLRFSQSLDGRIAIGLQSGRFCIAQDKREVERAYRMKIVRPGMDRVIAFDADFDPGSVTIADLVDLRSLVARHERPAPFGYRSVLIAPTRAARYVADVFSATWQGMPRSALSDRRPEHHVVDCYEDATRLFGVSDLEAQIRALRPPLGAYRAI